LCAPAPQGHTRDEKNRFFDFCLGDAQAEIKKRETDICGGSIRALVSGARSQ
jgi:hypothetical protein